MFSGLDICFVCDAILFFYKAYSKTFPVLDIFSGKLGPGFFFRKIFLPPPPPHTHTHKKNNQMVAPLVGYA